MSTIIVVVVLRLGLLWWGRSRVRMELRLLLRLLLECIHALARVAITTLFVLAITGPAAASASSDLKLRVAAAAAASLLVSG